MIFESIEINNFRNFERIKVSLSNKNVFFGLNDVGKTNFLYALRFLLDREVRIKGFLDSDFHKKNIEHPIEIILKINIEDSTCTDNQKLRAKLEGAVQSGDTSVYIKLQADYNSKEMVSEPFLYWGGNLNRLVEMKQRGYMYEVDYIINVIYIDSYIDINKLFKKNIKTLVKNESEGDKAIYDQIENIVSDLNEKISSLSGILKFEEEISPIYQRFRNEGISISVKSEIAIRGLYSNIIPYIKKGDSSELYPTSGEGRKKLLCYSILEMIAKDVEDLKVNIFLIEEPENHLHKSVQIALSQILFRDEDYKYLFITTHSPYILQEMDQVNLIRIYNQARVNSSSEFYIVPEEFKDNRRMLNKNLAEAIFADRVLLVEGPSETVLFEKILSTINPAYEADGVYILEVNGVGFKNYTIILKGLDIPFLIKTDNDLRKNHSTQKYTVLGFHRINGIVKEKKYILPIEEVNENSVEIKKSLYNENIDLLNELRKKGYYLSKSDLENDLNEVLGEKLENYFETKNPVKHLQEAKLYNMVDLINKISDDDCELIYNHYNFACLKKVLEWK